MLLGSFAVCLLIFLGIGLLSATKKQSTARDYHLAGQGVKPWLVSLSAVATANSGYMFIGMVGFTYSVGLSSVWLLFGWVFGDYLASLFIHKRLRVKTDAQDTLSFAGAISQWHNTHYPYLRSVAGLIILAFLGTYAAAQLKAGSKALQVLLGWELSLGAIIGAIMVLLYSIAGGIRASIWTDAAQSLVMFVAMAMLCITAVHHLDGLGAVTEQLQQVSPTYLNWFASSAHDKGLIGPILFGLGWLFAGFGVVGQPHIMVRFMTMENPKDMNRVRLYYYCWYSAFSVLTIGVGLMARLLIPDTQQFDPELALPTLAQLLLAEVWVGLILAGLFAATLSTADSQIICCASALTQDFPKKTRSYLLNKLATLTVTSIALGITLMGSDSVFTLVLVAWSALASAFAPLLATLCSGGKPSERLSLLMIGCGLACMLLWRILGLNDWVYEVGPGILGGFLPLIINRSINRVFNRTINH